MQGKPYAGNPHVRFDEGEVAPAATPRRGSLLYISANPKSFGIGCDTEVSGTLLESLYKDPPLVFREASYGNP